MGTTEAELRQNAELERARLGTTLEAIGDRLSPERVVERRKAAVGQRFKRMREAVMGSPDYVEPVTNRTTDAARTAADKVQHAPEMMVEQTRGNPVAAGLIAFGIGALVATAFPKTRAEQHLVETARQSLDSAKDELRSAGRDVAADVREHTKSAAQEVTSAGKKAAQNVAEQTTSSAQNVADEARQRRQ